MCQGLHSDLGSIPAFSPCISLQLPLSNKAGNEKKRLFFLMHDEEKLTSDRLI